MIDKLKGRATFIAAVNSADKDQVFGWACYEVPALHFIYVKKPFRRFGIAAALLHHAKHDGQWYATHWRAPAEFLARKFNIRRIDL
jgi:GNAT superfamily N-acetyltransferase